MKILFIFCDMLRANLLKTFNDDIDEKGLMDYWFERLGGTSYTNCYSPAPDTPRSTACLWSGKYPKNNGCCKRLHWPKYYLRKDIFTLFDLLEMNNYSMYFKCSKGKEQIGFLPEKNYKRMKVFDDLDEFLNKLDEIFYKNDKIFSFISLTDYHWAMDDYDHNSWGDHYGQMHLSNCFKKIFGRFSPHSFDYIFIFSDHGCKLNSEIRKERKIYLINDDRSKIVLFVHKKKDNKIIKKSRLTSIMDILPTLVDIMNYKGSCSFDGLSLLSEDQNKYIVIEDYLGFPPGIKTTHELWGIRTESHFYLTGLSDSVFLNVLANGKYEEVKNPNILKINEFNDEISNISCSYLENKKLHDLTKKYELMKKLWSSKKTYSDGEKRKNENNFIFKKIYHISKISLFKSLSQIPTSFLKVKLNENKYKRW